MGSCRRSPAFSLLLVISLFLAGSFLLCLDVRRRSPSKTASRRCSIARALQEEFPESEHGEGETDPGGFNNSVTVNQAVLETVARVSSKKNETKEEKSFQFQNFINNENQAEDIPTLIDRKCSDKLGLSLELGSFAAGMMISTTDLSQHTLEQVL